jgi:hypothetical protein
VHVNLSAEVTQLVLSETNCPNVAFALQSPLAEIETKACSRVVAASVAGK